MAGVVWTGGPLPDAQFDEFMLLMRLPDKPQTLYFKVAQACEQGRNDWTQVPEPGKPSRRFPAPSLDVVRAAEKPHRHQPRDRARQACGRIHC